VVRRKLKKGAEIFTRRRKTEQGREKGDAGIKKAEQRTTTSGGKGCQENQEWLKKVG